MIREIAGSFDRSVAYVQGLVGDLAEEEMYLRPPGAPNHAAWTLGHLIHACEAMAGELGVAPWLPADWGARFGYGSTPAAPPAPGGPSGEGLPASFADAARRMRTALLATDEGRMGEPPPDEAARGTFPTLGDALLQVLCAHTAFHAGQLAAWRRAIGRPPVGVFV